jgi:hypothetical protein
MVVDYHYLIGSMVQNNLSFEEILLSLDGCTEESTNNFQQHLLFHLSRETLLNIHGYLES